ncbi:MAG TPA: hypothetical protein VGZ22_12950 [Isosphaeraceae bacterium]|jgi:hypothetical protein|nr:hypothetical protein [Isosphaeraceae bacterium]
MDEPNPLKARSQARQFFALIIIGSATAQALGMALKLPTQLVANDISRWCTVWSLLERGTYAIDDCPWQSQTQDKVLKPAPFQTVPPGGKPVEHYYSSKPPLLPTMIAGLLYPIRKVTGVSLDVTYNQERNARWVAKEAPDEPGRVKYELETPKEPVKWPVYVFYFKPIVVLFNVVPLLIFLVFYVRVLDRYADGDWAWFVSLFAAAWGTQLLVFDLTLNNHTIAAYSAFFAIYAFLRIENDGLRSPLYFALAGLFAAFCACNELPAALFGLALFAILLAKFPRSTLFYFVPAAALPCLAFLGTQWLAMGQLRPAYEEFGTKSYQYYGSYWNTPLEFDWFNKHPEPYPVYLFHMTFGHHGVFSLTPIFLFSLYAIFLHMIGRLRRMTDVAWLTAFLTAAMLAFYTWNPKARNYGGSTQGLRWLFWLFPFWLVLLPMGIERGQTHRGFRWLTLAALMLSVFSVGYALRSPWSHPWILDAMEHLNMYKLER